MDLIQQFGPAVSRNLTSLGSFRPELALTFGTMALFLVDVVVRKSALPRSSARPPPSSPASRRTGRGSSTA